MNNKTTLIYLFSFLSLFSMTVTADLNSVKDCYMNKDYLCSYNALIKFIEEDPINQSIVSQRSGLLTPLGHDLSLFFVQAEVGLSPESVILNADKGIILIATSSENKTDSANLIPYYTLKAEACEALKDKACFQNNADKICTTLIKSGFSWPRKEEANTPLSGRERVKVIKSQCSDAAKEDLRNASIYPKINAYIAAITSNEDLDKYQTLFFSPNMLKRMHAKNKWPEVKEDLEKRNPNLLKVLSYIKDKKADFEFYSSGYRATFDLSDYPDNTSRKTVIFSMRDGVWYLR